MRTIQPPILPDKGAWSPPSDNDLFWISLCNWAIYEWLRRLSEGGILVQQTETTDAQDLIDSINTQIQDVVTQIDANWMPGGGG